MGEKQKAEKKKKEENKKVSENNGQLRIQGCRLDQTKVGENNGQLRFRPQAAKIKKVSTRVGPGVRDERCP